MNLNPMFCQLALKQLRRLLQQVCYPLIFGCVSSRADFYAAVSSSLGRGQHAAVPRNCLLEALDAEKCNSDGEMIDTSVPALKARVKHRKKRVKRVTNTVDSDPEDINFVGSESASESAGDSDEEDAEAEKDVPNSEVCKIRLTSRRYSYELTVLYLAC